MRVLRQPATLALAFGALTKFEGAARAPSSRMTDSRRTRRARGRSFDRSNARVVDGRTNDNVWRAIVIQSKTALDFASTKSGGSEARGCRFNVSVCVLLYKFNLKAT